MQHLHPLSAREQTRERIMRTADKLFRRLGFTKTTVADIAAELKMSPANIYKFFPSKNAIIQAGADRSLEEKKKKLRAVALAKQSPTRRLHNVALTIYRNHERSFAKERQIYKLVVAATEENWPCIQNYRDFLAELVSDIIRDGVKKGDLRPLDVEKTTRVLLDSMVWVTNPLLFNDIAPREAEKRIDQQMRLLEKALRN